MAFVSGVVQTFCNLYLAYLRYKKKDQERADKRMEDHTKETNENKVLVGGIGGTKWEREAGAYRISDAVQAILP